MTAPTVPARQHAPLLPLPPGTRYCLSGGRIIAGEQLANFITATAEEIKILTMLSGHNRTMELSTEDLRAMDLNTAALTGLKMAGYDRPLPMWENSSQPVHSHN